MCRLTVPPRVGRDLWRLLPVVNLYDSLVYSFNTLLPVVKLYDSLVYSFNTLLPVVKIYDSLVF